MDKYDAFIDKFLTDLKTALPISRDMLLEDFKKLPTVPLIATCSQGKSTSYEPFPYQVSITKMIMHPTKEQSDSFAKTTIEPTQTMRKNPVLDLPKAEKGFLKMASSFKKSENIISKLIACDEIESANIKPIIQPRKSHFKYSHIVKNREDFQREAFGQRIINVFNGTRFYFDPEYNCNVYESWLGLHYPAFIENKAFITDDLGLPWEPKFEPTTQHETKFTKEERYNLEYAINREIDDVKNLLNKNSVSILRDRLSKFEKLLEKVRTI